MKILRINHLGVAPKDPEQAKRFFGQTLGLKESDPETVTDQKVIVDFFSCGESRLEVLTPTDAESPISRFLEKKGAGLHHVAIEVDDIEAWLDHLKQLGIELIDQNPRSGAHHTRIAFVHPRATGGVLVELVQETL
jgi:methylmalonyl-CoA/ethylmalonyl-CoA epimerase